MQQLNWSPRPYRGDVQLGWRYAFPHAPPGDILKKLLCMCRGVLEGTDYEYVWRTGFLYKTAEVGKAGMCVTDIVVMSVSGTCGFYDALPEYEIVL